MKSFSKLLLAEYKQFYRDKTALFFTFAFPVLFMLLFGAVFGNEMDVEYNLGVLNNDDSQISAQMANALGEIPIFTIVEEATFDELYQDVKDGEIVALIIIPSGITDSLTSGETVDITIYYDPTDTTSSQIILSALNEMITIANYQITQSPVIFNLAEESIQAKDLRYIDYLVPGVVGMSVMFLGLYGALPMVEWRQKKIMKRFSATPIRRATMVSTQIAYRLLLTIIQTFILILIAYLIFDVVMLGNWLLFFGFTLLGTMTMISIGYMIVSRVATVEGANSVIGIVQFPMLFLSGVFWPLDFFPDYLLPVVKAIPLTYLVDSLQQIMSQSIPVNSLAVNALVLSAWLVGSIIVTIRFFRWE
jgi:ABC-2 type transport system permease protein